VFAKKEGQGQKPRRKPKATRPQLQR
jgi:hypothetical protein